MHFRTLATVYFQPLEEDETCNKTIFELREEVSKQIESGNANFLARMLYQSYSNRLTEFARRVEFEISEIMDRYASEPEDEDYLEFIDVTEDLKQDYAESVDCLKLPNGKIVELNYYPYYRKYKIIDGLVYQQNVGQLHHDKRTKQAKKIAALPNYPRSKVYKSFKAYAEDFRGYSYNSEHKAYGYVCNPNAMWDWYQIGGRWPTMFLVKDTCTEYSLGERSWCNENEEFPAPDGCMWVSAARKKDILWDEIREWTKKQAIERYKELSDIFAAGVMPEGEIGMITEEGILYYKGHFLFKKGETLEEYLKEHTYSDDWKYPFSVGDIVNGDDWFSENDCELDSATGKFEPVDWRKKVDEYVDDLDDEDILVTIDYHM